jgi:[acyl-carrier-protein] S-malonyltransferase
MAAVIGLDADSLREKRDGLGQKFGTVEIVNFNSPTQQIISGHREAVQALADILSAEGIKCSALPVSAPFHSTLMAPAREEMASKLEDTPLRATERPVIANISGKLSHPYSIDNLIRQIDSPVLWTDSLLTALEHGCDTFFEIGPGKVLFGLARKTIPRGLKIISSDAIDKAIEQARALSD